MLNIQKNALTIILCNGLHEIKYNTDLDNTPFNQGEKHVI